MVYLGVAASILVLMAFVSAVIWSHLRAIAEARAVYHQALHRLAASPNSNLLRTECKEAGRYYYRFLHIQEHATFQDFPIPYTEYPEADDSRIESDIAETLRHEPPAA